MTNGLFAHVRNPIFTAMIATGAGLTLLAPNAIAVIAFTTLVAAIEIQVRVVEEPYLLRTHGERYTALTLDAFLQVSADRAACVRRAVPPGRA
nr:methyltransferase [Lentzea kentuckyensis]